jgi:hypothetical protein
MVVPHTGILILQGLSGALFGVLVFYLLGPSGSTGYGRFTMAIRLR